MQSVIQPIPSPSASAPGVRIADALEKIHHSLRELIGILSRREPAVPDEPPGDVLMWPLSSPDPTPDIPLIELNVTARTYNCLANRDLDTLRKICTTDIPYLKHFGRLSARELALELIRRGLPLPLFVRRNLRAPTDRVWLEQQLNAKNAGEESDEAGKD